MEEGLSDDMFIKELRRKVEAKRRRILWGTIFLSFSFLLLMVSMLSLLGFIMAPTPIIGIMIILFPIFTSLGIYILIHVRGE